MNTILLRDSFEAIKPYAKDFTAHFYQTLFQNNPEAKALFHKADMAKQQDLLINSLVFIVGNLENTELLTDYLKNMGRRHHENYGVENAHYGLVAEALLSTLRYYFEETWTPELEQTWTEALTFIAQTMQSYAVSTESKPKEAVMPVNVVEEFQKQVNKVVQDCLLRALRDPKIHEEVRKVAGVQAQKLMMQALQEEFSGIRKEIQPKIAAA